MKLLNTRALKAAVLASVMFSCITQASEVSSLVATTVMGKNGTTVEFDFINNNKVSAMDFRMPIGKVEGKVNIGQCAGGLSDSHVGSCAIKNGELRVVVFSPTNAELRSGNIGSITLPSVHLKSKGTYELTHINMVGADSKPREFEALSGIEK